MLCEKCHQREAIIYLTQFVGDKVSHRNFCRECGAAMGIPTTVGAGWTSYSPPLSDLDQMTQLLGQNAPYPIEAYEFVREALLAAEAAKATREPRAAGGHVSGKELLETLRSIAIARFGAKAKLTLNGWKIHRTEDFGEIVFHMIRVGFLAANPDDSKDDFKNGFDFDDAFPEN